MASIEQALLVVGILLVVSVVASRASGRLGVPALLLFLVIGMLAGSEGPGGIDFTDAGIAQFVGVLALVFILFSGGLDTAWRDVRPVLARGVTLATVGVAITAGVMGAFAYFVLGFPLLVALLLGSIVSSTDAAAVFGTLRGRNVRLRGKLKPLLELESGSNDPMAVLLTIGLTSAILDPATTWTSFVWLFVKQMALGSLLGVALGKVMVWSLNRVRLDAEGLYPVLTLAFALFAYGGTSVVGGNGFLAVYVAGIMIGNERFAHRGSLLRFHDGVAWLMQITMFLVLGLLVFPSRLVGVATAGLAASLCLIFLARPLSVFACLAPFRDGPRSLALVSWVGLRGAVPIILATFPLVAGVPGAETIFDIVFFIVLTSVLVQGPTLAPMARLLRVDAPGPAHAPAPLALDHTPGMRGDLTEVVVPRDSPIAGRRVLDLGLRGNVLITLLGRGDEFFVPGGSTIIEGGDRLIVLAEPEGLADVRRIVGAHEADEEDLKDSWSLR